MAKVGKPRAEAENVELVAELKTENDHLRKRVAGLEDRLSTLENKYETLEREMGNLEQAHRDRDDEEDTQLLSMREDIESL
jgi:phage shock protein A